MTKLLKELEVLRAKQSKLFLKYVKNRKETTWQQYQVIGITISFKQTEILNF
jgi:hypothetical protein